MNAKDKLEAYLQQNAVPYMLQHHPRAFTAHQVAASEHIPGTLLAKVVVVLAAGKPVMLVLPASERVYLPEIARVLGADDLRLAEEREFAPTFPDCEVGAIPPFGNLYDVPVYVDALLTADDTIYFQAGTHTDTMSIKYSDFARLVNPIVAPFSVEETVHYRG